MSLNYVTLTFTEQDAANDAGSGSVSIAPTSVVTAAGVTVVSQTPVVRNMSAGSLSVMLVACDNSGTAPAAGFWAYEITLPGQSSPGLYLVNYANGATQRFDNLTTAVASTTYGPAATGGVTSFATRTGAVTPQSGDYTAAQVTNAADKSSGSTQAFTGNVSAPAFAATGLTGATAASRYVGATASGAPASGTFALGDFVIDQSGKVWVCTTAGTVGSGAVFTQAGSALDSTAADFQPDGVAAAGSTGKAADAGHVHPLQPWQFKPEAYGAKGDVRIVSDAAITSGQHQLTSSTAAFTSGDAGKTVYVVGAGASGADLVTTIATYTNSTTVQLTATAGSTVSGKGAVIATDDTAAVKSAYAAAHAFALADPGRRAQIVLSKLYGLAGAATTGGGTLGNAIIPLTIVNPSTTQKIRIEWAGDGTSVAAELAHWLQPAPQTSGPGLVCLRLDGTNDSTYGPASIIGGPVDGYGASASVFSNMAVVLSNFRFIMPFNSTFGGADFLGLAEDYETGVAAQPLAIVPSGGAWPQFNQASITNQYTFAIRKSDTNNNDWQDMSGCSCEGLCYGFMVSEHTTWDSLRVIYCINGLELYAGANMPHGIRGGHLSAEDCANAVGVYGVLPFGNLVKATIAQVDIESSSLLFDSNNLMSGSIGVMANNTPGYGVYTVTGGHAVKVYELMAITGPVSSPQAAPANNTAWVNSYNADAWITMSATTITAVTITGPTGTAVAQKGLAGSPASYALFLPAGSSYTPTYTGSLAHTVTLVGRP